MGELVECEHSDQMTMLMSLALDGALDRDGQHRLKCHLAGCSSCQSEWQSMRQLSTFLESQPMVGPPLGFAVRVERQLAARETKRRRAFGGIAVLTSSLSLAGMTALGLVVVVLALLGLQVLGSAPAMQQGASAFTAVASGLGLLGKGASLFLGDILLRYGPPLIIFLGIGLVVMAGMWIWLFVKRPGSSHRKGYV
jgi:anti-sigma factor RsiW